MSTKEMFIRVGNDNGNSEHDLVIEGNIIRQPNVYGRVRKLPNMDEISETYVTKNIHDNLITSIASPTINNGAASTYYVGSYAERSGINLRNIEVGADNSKINSDVPVINTLSQIAAYCVKQSLLEDAEVTEIATKVHMTTCLPVTQYSKSNATTFAEKFYNGPHNVTVHVANKLVKVVVNFEFVKVLPESVPVVFYLQQLIAGDKLTDADGEKKLMKLMFEEFNKAYDLSIDGSYFKNKKILHVAIGEGTTEYPLTEDIRFNPNFIHGSNNGVGHAINSVLPEFISEKNLLKFTRQDFSRCMRDTTHKYHEDAKDMVEIPLEDQADIILGVTKREIGKANNDVDIVAVHGGGSILMKEHLKQPLENFCTPADIKVFYVPESKAVTLESLGMYAFTVGKIFASLVKKHVSDNK